MVKDVNGCLRKFRDVLNESRFRLKTGYGLCFLSPPKKLRVALVGLGFPLLLSFSLVHFGLTLFRFSNTFTWVFTS